MTNHKDDEQNRQSTMGFKEQILAELEKANQIRKEKEEELLQQGLAGDEFRKKEQEVREAAQKTAQLYQDYQKETSQTWTSHQDNQEKGSCQIDLSQEVAQTKESDISKTIPYTPVMMADKEDDFYSAEGTNFADEKSGSSPESGGIVRHHSARRQKADKMAKKISTIVITTIVILILSVGLFATIFVYRAVNPVDKNDNTYVQVEIPVGSGNKLIGQVLEKEGVIRSATVFNFYTKFKNYSNFQSGYYNLQKSMTLDDISKALQNGGTDHPTKPALGKILIPEGFSIRQIAKAIQDNVNTKTSKDKTPFSSKEFLNLVQDEAFIKEMVRKYPKLLASIPKKSDAVYQLEGYLFPATYSYYKNTSMRDIVDEMLATTDATLAPYYDRIAASGKSVNDVLTLASLVEKEGSTDVDRRYIASVFYNRLNNGMALQSNIAILYAMGKLGDKTTLAEDAAIDTTINSPYNIYTNTGLMPGPVDSPGVAAIDATVKPADTDYLYFVANVHTGEVFYARTYDEHSANVQKYVNDQIQ
ncbi:endolytic transglycosylase MltG [Streptococcus iniae]|nr:endolytic transglycosylase MltG [Streptococcus iniae]